MTMTLCLVSAPSTGEKQTATRGLGAYERDPRKALACGAELGRGPGVRQEPAGTGQVSHPLASLGHREPVAYLAGLSAVSFVTHHIIFHSIKESFP